MKHVFHDAGDSDQKPASNCGFSISEAFGGSGGWDLSGREVGPTSTVPAGT